MSKADNLRRMRESAFIATVNRTYCWCGMPSAQGRRQCTRHLLPPSELPCAFCGDARCERGTREHTRADARSKAQYAIKKGLIVKQPCEVCGAEAEGHHDDYSKPLDLRWLCKKHHAGAHPGGYRKVFDNEQLAKAVTDIVPEKRGRGRPRKWASETERVKAYRDRKK